MPIDKKELAGIAEKAKVIVRLDVMEFLKMIEEKAKAWKKDLHG